MPSDLQEALLSHLFKNTLMDSAIFTDFRPMTNLAFISKIVYSLVAGSVSSPMEGKDC